jgi:hypothetical protein
MYQFVPSDVNLNVLPTGIVRVLVVTPFIVLLPPLNVMPAVPIFLTVIVKPV